MFGTTRHIHHRSFAITASTAATLAFASLGTQKQARCYGHANPTNNRLKDKTVLITGATAGIGRACVLKFAEQETRLVLVGRRKDKLEEVKKAALTVNPALKILTVPMSVSDTEEVAKLPEKLPAEFRDVSILVNNAGLALGVAGEISTGRSSKLLAKGPSTHSFSHL
jgi:enoyl-[acyl-carrier-protein] reductase (NADH)